MLSPGIHQPSTPRLFPGVHQPSTPCLSSAIQANSRMQQQPFLLTHASFGSFPVWMKASLPNQAPDSHHNNKFLICPPSPPPCLVRIEWSPVATLSPPLPCPFPLYCHCSAAGLHLYTSQEQRLSGFHTGSFEPISHIAVEDSLKRVEEII